LISAAAMGRKNGGLTRLAGNVKRAVRQSLLLTCAWYVFDDWRARRRLARGDLATRSGARHHNLPLEQSIAYVERVHNDYLAYAGRDRFTGVVGEIGPGDNFGLALLLLGSGAETVHAIDRYASERDAQQQAAIYRALAERRDLQNCFDGRPGEDTMRGLVRHAGTPAEHFFRDRAGQFDAVVSRAVLEHLYDPIAALDDMAAAMRPGGILVHRIDLRDHGMFAGRHPLTFLTLPDRLHRAMTRGAGRPNRVLMPAWRDWLAGSGLRGSVRITRLAGVDGEIEPAAWNDIDADKRETALAAVQTIRPKLARSLTGFDDRDLAVSGCVLVAEKPPHSAANSVSN
jgi:SAM-dependent methyltransferase